MTDELTDFRRAARKQRLRFLGLALVAIALIGLVPIPFGAGYFGWRVVRYERVPLWTMNTTGELVTIEIGGQSRALDPGEVGSLMFRAGEQTLVLRGEDGTERESLPLVSDNQAVFYNPLGSHCWGVLDASRLYATGRPPDEVPYTLIASIGEGDRLYPIPTGTFLPPGSIPPASVQGGQNVIWIERGGCSLVTPANEHLFTGQLIVRIEARRERRAEEEARVRRALGGGAE